MWRKGLCGYQVAHLEIKLGSAAGVTEANRRMGSPQGPGEEQRAGEGEMQVGSQRARQEPPVGLQWELPLS